MPNISRTRGSMATFFIYMLQQAQSTHPHIHNTRYHFLFIQKTKRNVTEQNADFPILWIQFKSRRKMFQISGKFETKTGYFRNPTVPLWATLTSGFIQTCTFMSMLLYHTIPSSIVQNTLKEFLISRVQTAFEFFEQIIFEFSLPTKHSKSL